MQKLINKNYGKDIYYIEKYGHTNGYGMELYTAIMAEDNKKEPDKQPTSIELTGNYETQHDRSLLYPVEAWIVNNELEVTFHEPTSNVTLTVIGTSGVVFSQTISFNSFQTETINLYGCPKGIYTLTITTPQGTYLSGMFEIE